MTISEIMTARTEITAIEVTATLDEVKQMLAESGHSRLPVYEGTLDHILGILYARDLLKYLGAGSDPINIRQSLRAQMRARGKAADPQADQYLFREALNQRACRHVDSSVAWCGHGRSVANG